MRKALGAVWGRSDLTMPMGLLAMGLLETLVIGQNSPIWAQVPLTFAWSLPLIWRRRWPVPVLGFVILVGPIIERVNEEGGVTSFALSATLAAYTVGRELDPPATWWGPALTVGFGWVYYAATDGELSDYVFIALLYGGAWAVGHTIRRRDLQVGELTKQTRDLERSHEEQKRLAIEQERTRIARELHDIVAHSISLISIQAQVVRRSLSFSGSEETEALRIIETTARRAMVDMRRLLQVLRADDNAPALAPQPSLEQLSDLVSESKSTGIDVEISMEGDPVPLDPGIGLTAYRVIQESLTNVRRHTDSATAQVKLRYELHHLHITVEDPGPTRREDSLDHYPRGGLGLTGMRERVKLYGGTLKAGHTLKGGFEVHVALPLSPIEISTP